MCLFEVKDHYSVGSYVEESNGYIDLRERVNKQIIEYQDVKLETYIKREVVKRVCKDSEFEIREMFKIGKDFEKLYQFYCLGCGEKIGELEINIKIGIAR